LLVNVFYVLIGQKVQNFLTLERCANTYTPGRAEAVGERGYGLGLDQSLFFGYFHARQLSTQGKA